MRRFLPIAVSAFATLISLLLLTRTPHAQAGAGRAEAAENFYLDVAHPVLAPGESSLLTVRLKLTAPLQTGAADVSAGLAAGASDDFGLRYRIDHWQILESGVGQLIVTSGTQDVATYRAPATKPAQGFVTITVDLVPKFTGTAKVTLFARIAIGDDDTTFMLDVPGLGIAGERYTFVNDPSPVERALAALPPEQRAALQGRMQAAGAARGVNTEMLLAKARALYSENDQNTGILIQLPPVGKTPARGMAAPTTVHMDAAVSIVFKGRGTGTFAILPDDKDNKNIATITRPSGEGFVSGHGRYVERGGSRILEMNCSSCTITISRYDTQRVIGSVRTDVTYFRGQEIVLGRLVGRFNVPVASR